MQAQFSVSLSALQDINAQGISSTLEKMLFNSRFDLLVSALDQDILLLPFPPNFKRAYDADDENDVILDDALACCIMLLRQLCHGKPLDRMRYFLSLRTLVRQLIALRMWKSALKLSTKIIPLLHDFSANFPNEFHMDLIVAHATHALLLGADSRLLEAKSICEGALKLAKQIGMEANAHPIYPLILRISAYFVGDIPSRLEYLLEAANYYRSSLPSSLELYTLPFAETLSSLGRCHLKQHQPQLAIRVLEEAEKMFRSLPSTPPEDLIICFIRLGQAFQATAQLSEANEALDRAHNALQSANLQDKTSLRNQLVRVRQGHNIPSSVSAQTDPTTILSAVMQLEKCGIDIGMSIGYPLESFCSAAPDAERTYYRQAGA
jgi:tetratricopeptide (TPR) repeat protein